jgi:hypothetical protein
MDNTISRDRSYSRQDSGSSHATLSVGTADNLNSEANFDDDNLDLRLSDSFRRPLNEGSSSSEDIHNQNETDASIPESRRVEGAADEPIRAVEIDHTYSPIHDDT